MKPSEFWSSSDSDKLYMTAYMLSKSEMQAVENFEMEKKLDEAKRKQRNGR